MKQALPIEPRDYLEEIDIKSERRLWGGNGILFIVLALQRFLLGPLANLRRGRGIALAFWRGAWT